MAYEVLPDGTRRWTRNDYMGRGDKGLSRTRVESATFTPRARIDRKHHPIDTFKGLVEANGESPAP